MTSAEDTSSFTTQEAKGVQMRVDPNLKGPLTASDPLGGGRPAPGRDREL